MDAKKQMVELRNSNSYLYLKTAALWLLVTCMMGAMTTMTLGRQAVLVIKAEIFISIVTAFVIYGLLQLIGGAFRAIKNSDRWGKFCLITTMVFTVLLGFGLMREQSPMSSFSTVYETRITSFYEAWLFMTFAFGLFTYTERTPMAKTAQPAVED